MITTVNIQLSWHQRAFIARSYFLSKDENPTKVINHMICLPLVSKGQKQKINCAPRKTTWNRWHSVGWDGMKLRACVMPFFRQSPRLPFSPSRLSMTNSLLPIRTAQCYKVLATCERKLIDISYCLWWQDDIWCTCELSKFMLYQV